MIVSDLIARLQKLPQHLDVAIVDQIENQSFDDDDGSAFGIRKDFEVEIVDNSNPNRGQDKFCALIFNIE
jgi:hypothetical protein